MDKVVTNMVDGKQITGVLSTIGAAMTQHLDVVEPLVTIVVTIVVGALTALYTYERWRKLRAERKSKERKD